MIIIQPTKKNRRFYLVLVTLFFCYIVYREWKNGEHNNTELVILACMYYFGQNAVYSFLTNGVINSFGYAYQPNEWKFFRFTAFLMGIFFMLLAFVHPKTEESPTYNPQVIEESVKE
jgi:hypothetical protein